MRAEQPAGGLRAGYTIRDRRDGDDEALLRTENRAAELFRAHGHPDIADNPLESVAALRAMLEGNRCWVAAREPDAPVGYAIAGPLGSAFHLREVSVDPAHGRRGLGAALVGAVTVAARTSGASMVSLTTFRDVPFNMPFYARLGFAEIALTDAPQLLRDAFDAELPPGTDPDARVLMVQRL